MVDKIEGHIASVEVREGILDHEVENCPICNSELQSGFGLAGGGFGVYGYCESCGMIVWKVIMEE